MITVFSKLSQIISTGFIFISLSSITCLLL
uniref:Uncharacterized protein n=1 Tax=Siphoviridae sp. ctrpg19 TaxID=2826481 RepID=A0A8S5MK09_9CAUD|nr:MAG TPA: hypothetical protein [Siphoviridae sp. ctrpg19]